MSAKASIINDDSALQYWYMINSVIYYGITSGMNFTSIAENDIKEKLKGTKYV